MDPKVETLCYRQFLSHSLETSMQAFNHPQHGTWGQLLSLATTSIKAGGGQYS